MRALAVIAILSGRLFAVMPTPVFHKPKGTVVTIESPIAAQAEDPSLGFAAVFPPVPSCLSSVTLVIYVQRLGLLERMSMYQDMYGPYVGAIEFYVDGTWCDPRATSDFRLPCYGEQLNRSTLPDGVKVLDRTGGGWMMQNSLIDAITAPRETATTAGYLFMADDVLLNIGQLSRAANESGCDRIMRSATLHCEDVTSRIKEPWIYSVYIKEARDFFEQSDERFRTQLAENVGSPSTYCVGTQNDFIYIPTGVAAEWARVAQQMTDAGLVFVFAFYSAIFGIARNEDMIVLNSKYLNPHFRATHMLADAEFDDAQQPYCWRGAAADIDYLLAMHIIHPNKLASSPTAWNFAMTVNPPGAHVSLNCSNTSDGTVGDHCEGERGRSAFWCGE